MVSGTKDGEGRAFKFATLSIVGRNIPLVLAVEPVRESSAWDENPPNQIHRTVRRLVRRAKSRSPSRRSCVTGNSTRCGCFDPLEPGGEPPHSKADREL